MKTLNREIIRLSVPAILSNITMPLLALSDTTICGHLGSEIFIGAVSVGSMMLNVVFWLFGFLRMGTTGLTAQAFGCGDLRAQAEVFTRALAVGLGIGVIITALQHPLKLLLTLLIAPGPDVLPLAHRYFDICIWGAPALLGTMAVLGWLLGTQTTLLPMIISISVNVVNILLSVALVFWFDVGFQGVALGTLIANWGGFFLALLMARYRVRGTDMHLWCGFKSLLKSSGLGKFLRVNSDIFFRSAYILGVSMTITAIGARLGSMTLAANAVMVQFYIFFSYFMDGFAFTGEALCGRFYGEKNQQMLRRSMVLLLRWSAAMAVTFFAIYLIWNREIVSFITDDAAVIDHIMDYRIWLILTPPLSVLAFIFDGFYIGITATRRMLVVTAIAATLFFAICFLHITDGSLVVGIPDNNTLWGAFMTYLLTRGVLLALMTKRAFFPVSNPQTSSENA